MRFATAVLACVMLAAPIAAGAEEASAPRASQEELARQAIEAKKKTFTGDVETGWNLFHSKNCIRCHAVWGEGGQVGPDLGRTRTMGRATAGQLAGIMWNHVPRMWQKMEEGSIQIVPISPEEMSHLFAFLLFIRYADEPGDPEAGQRVINRAGCQKCHSLSGEGNTVGPDIAKWARFVNPVVWAQKMWKHAPQMQETMARMGIKWPEFTGTDLNDMVAFIRSRTAGDGKEYLRPGSTARGRDLFDKRGCASCHKLGEAGGVGPDLQNIDLPETLVGIAARMWNHAPKMLAAVRRSGGSEKAGHLTAQDMVDIITYLTARRYFLLQGDPKQGWKVFFKKQCVTCHAVEDWGSHVGPKLTFIKGNASPVFMAHVMWRFGPKMLSAMADRGIEWPHFEGAEMDDLIAFLNTQTGVERTP